MHSCGIVAEYNPFHAGHAFHLAETRRRLGEDCALVCAMSGSFVQRGESAVFSKFARAEAAVRCGADMVLELPLPWSLASAEGFARGAVGLLAAAGVEALSFGSECGDTKPLYAALEAIQDPRFPEALLEALAEKTAQLCLAFPEVEKAVVRITKPAAALRQEKIAVEIERSAAGD